MNSIAVCCIPKKCKSAYCDSVACFIQILKVHVLNQMKNLVCFRLTAADPFGRIENKHAYTVNNIFKYDRWHSMSLFKEHHPTRWSWAQYLDVMHAAVMWYEFRPLTNSLNRFLCIAGKF